MIRSFYYLYNERGKLFIDLLRSVISPYFTVYDLLKLTTATKLFNGVVDDVMKDRLHPDLMFQYDPEWKGTVAECVVKRVYETNDELSLEQLVIICKYGMQCNYEFFFDVVTDYTTETHYKYNNLCYSRTKFYDFTKKCIYREETKGRHHILCDRCTEVSNNIKFIETEFIHHLMKVFSNMKLIDFLPTRFFCLNDDDDDDIYWNYKFRLMTELFSYIKREDWLDDFLNELIANEDEMERKIKVKIMLCSYMRIPNSTGKKNWVREIEAYTKKKSLQTIEITGDDDNFCWGYIIQ